MIDQEEFHDAFARLPDHRAVGADHLPLTRWERTRRLRLGRSRCDLDKAHPAIASDGQPLVIAESRNFLAGKLACLKDGRALRNFEFDAIYREFGH